MKLTDLQHAGRRLELPLQVQGATAQPLQLLSTLRVLPNKRYVGKASWAGREVLAKLLVGSSAERNYQQELAGAQLLAAQGMQTPQLLEHGFRPGEGGWLLFEFLDNAQNLGDEWQALSAQPLLSDAQQTLLGEALEVIARLHLQGLWQDDLHLDNLMRREGQLYLIDGGGVRAEQPGQALPRDKVLSNLGVFFAQLPAAIDDSIEELLVHYLLVNGEHALPLEALLKEVAKVRRWRLRDYLKKIGRDCTLFCARSSAAILQVVRREEVDNLAPVLSRLDSAIAEGQALKLGCSSTVAQIEHAGRSLVIKRYNIKGFFHWLKRFWRPSRAWHSWQEGNRLDFLGIGTPRPLAIVERRTLWLRRGAYLVTEHCSGEDIISRFRPYAEATGSAARPSDAELAALDQLFSAMLRERISHGDLKGTNVLWQDGRWLLIDLDAMQQHSSAHSFSGAYSRDRARFLRNWPQQSELYQLLDQRIPKTSELPEH